MERNIEIHHQEIKEQFKKQAEGYSSLSAHKQHLDQLVRLACPLATDKVLDVACGSGIVATAFAECAAHVTGVDLTPEMLEQAYRLKKNKGLTNIEFVIGDVNLLPFEGGVFDIVVTRFSFHHMISTNQVLSEMIRVCKPGGTILVADVAIPEDKRDQYDQMELLRDPSHVSALTPNEFRNLFATQGLSEIFEDHYLMEIDLEEQLNASSSEAEEQLRLMITKDIGIDSLGIKATQQKDSVKIYYPIHIFTAKNLAAFDLK
ncbi:class I SAM-dependent methyltransferase [Desertivirga arenae]|uniref:class I SAM-dependent methyltransferase n=1 Tax=Desertivirga arenae TaxID=2810309 RepID=UPI001A973E37|nr:methyltransferase domain-containing protein [Pedobacter sp. SYSU D00823]